LTNEEVLIDRAIAVVADTIDLAMGCKEPFLRFVHSSLFLFVVVLVLVQMMMMMMFFCFSFFFFCFY
jgi:hypothetical protein